jgi:hypothetical protein
MHLKWSLRHAKVWQQTLYVPCLHRGIVMLGYGAWVQCKGFFSYLDYSGTKSIIAFELRWHNDTVDIKWRFPFAFFEPQ